MAKPVWEAHAAPGETESVDWLDAVAAWLRYLKNDLPFAKKVWAGGFVSLTVVMTLLAFLLPKLPDALHTLFGLIAIAVFLVLIFTVGVRPLGEASRELELLKDEVDAARNHMVTPRGFHEASESIYGFNVRSLVVRTEVHDDGSGFTRTKRVVVATTAEVRELEHYSRGGSTGCNPTGKRTLEVDRDECAHRPSIEFRKATANELVWVLRFSPPLPRDDEYAYSYRNTTPPDTFSMDGDALILQTPPYEFRSTTIKYPTEELDTEVRLPEGMRPERTGYEVWCDRGAIPHRGEHWRIEQGGMYQEDREDGCLVLKLRVPHPILGLRYVVFWRPRRMTSEAAVLGMSQTSDGPVTIPVESV